MAIGRRFSLVISILFFSLALLCCDVHFRVAAGKHYKLDVRGSVYTSGGGYKCTHALFSARASAHILLPQPPLFRA